MTAVVLRVFQTGRRSPWSCVTLAALLALAHVLILMRWAPPGGFQSRYESFVSHDSYWFLNIIRDGYHTPVPPSHRKLMEVSNVAFFPAFPMWGRLVINATGLPPKSGLLLATHLATWLFWSYLLLLLRRWRVPLAVRCGVVLAIVAHPASFYLVAAYSESLFLALLLGYVFWNESRARGARLIAAAHGFVATATRIAGVPAALYPVVTEWSRARLETFTRRKRPGISPSSSALYFFRPPSPFGMAASEPSQSRLADALVACLAMSGALVFFLYCEARFGAWDLYMQTQHNGWGVYADYLAVLKPAAYARFWPEHWSVATEVGQFSVPLTMLLALVIAWWEVRAARSGNTRWRERIGLYFVAMALFYVAVSGVFSVRLESMLRYQFCTHVFLVLGVAHALTHVRSRHPLIRRTLFCAGAVLAVLSLALGLRYAAMFTHGMWVA